MWISRKEYTFLKENAEKNINAECEILAVKGEQQQAVARAMEEFSATLKQLDECKKCRMDVYITSRQILNTLLCNCETINMIISETIKTENGIESDNVGKFNNIESFASYIKCFNDINLSYIKENLNE